MFTYCHVTVKKVVILAPKSYCGFDVLILRDIYKIKYCVLYNSISRDLAFHFGSRVEYRISYAS